MPIVNISEAASIAGVARSTLYRKHKQGLISFSALPDGQPGIDTAELYRVYPQQLQQCSQDTKNATDATNSTPENTRKIAELQLELRLAREQLFAANEREKWLQQQVEGLVQAVKLLEHRPEQEHEQKPAEKRGFWSRLLGRGDK